MNVKSILFEKISELQKKIKKIKKRSIYCLLVGIIMAAFSFFTNSSSIFIRPNEIRRSPYGTQKTQYKLKVYAENLVNDMDFEVSVSPRKYTKEEADKIFVNKLEKLKVSILNQNEDFEHINSKLNFESDIGDGVKANYIFTPQYENKSNKKSKKIATKSATDEFSYYVKYQNLIDNAGNVKNQDFEIDDICTGYIEIQLSTEVINQDEKYKSEKYLLPITIISKKMSAIENFNNEFKKAINLSDKETANRDTIVLPDRVDDFTVRYKEPKDFSFLLFPVFGILIAILLEAKDKEKIREEEKKRKRYLENDFNQIISKILIYVSSGMTIRNSMIRLAEQYQFKCKKENIEKRIAYEELVVVKNKLTSGYNEIKAYEEMAGNINMRIYTRFLNIVIQSIKNGNKDLKNILNMEVQDALYERKQRAKKMGEEATTKLVLPLMMMLAVIMVVIMVPAFMGM